MNPRRKRHLLVAVNVVLAAGLVACASVLAFAPLRRADSASPADGPAQAAEDDRRPAAHPREWYAVICQHDLRRPLYDPAPVVVTKKPAPKPKLTIHLRGTVIEPGTEL